MDNFFKTVFVLCFCLIAACSSGVKGEPWQIEAIRQRDLAAKRITRELSLELIGTGGGLMGAVHKLSLDFRTDEQWSTSQARRYILQAHSIFLEQVNSSELVRAHAESDPLGPEQISINIVYFDPQGATTIVGTHFSDEISYSRRKDPGPGFEEFLTESLPQN